MMRPTIDVDKSYSIKHINSEAMTVSVASVLLRRISRVRKPTTKSSHSLFVAARLVAYGR